MRRSRATLPFVSLSLTLAAATAVAAPQKLPLDFDPNVAADPVATKKLVADEEATLPALDTSALTKTTHGAVSLWLWPAASTLLESASTSGPATMVWATPAVLCAKHGAFALPTALPNAPAHCDAAPTQIAEALGDREACRDVEEPERYVLGYEPAKVDLSVTSSIEGLIGLAGEALSHHDVPAGLLPADFRDTLRGIIVKLRAAALGKRIIEAKARYANALALAKQKAGCFSAASFAQLELDLAGLNAELDAAAAHIAQRESEGKAASAQEERCLAAQARVRKVLPFPALTRAEREHIAFWLGGVYWRMRGGGVMPLGSTQQARFYFLQQPFTRIGELTGAQDGADAAFQIYLSVFEGWGDWMDMGTGGGGGDAYYDLVAMTSRGHRQVKTSVDLLTQRSYDALPLLSGGLQMGACYYFSYDKLQGFRYAEASTPPYGSFIDGFTSDGEMCSGATIALGLARTLLNGTPSGKPKLDLCTSRACGDDGCGRSCGTCGASQRCDDGVCVELVDAATPAVEPPSAEAVPTYNAPPSARTDVPDARANHGCSCAHAGRLGSSSASRVGLALALAVAITRRRPAHRCV